MACVHRRKTKIIIVIILYAHLMLELFSIQLTTGDTLSFVTAWNIPSALGRWYSDVC